MFRRPSRLSNTPVLRIALQPCLNFVTFIIMTYLFLTLDRYYPTPCSLPQPIQSHPSHLASTFARHSQPLPSCAQSGTRAKTYLMVFMGHSGSSAIMSELKQHPQIHFEGSELVDHQPIFNTTAALQKTRSVFENGIAKGKTPGFKIRPAHILAQPHQWNQLVNEFDTRIIWQYRRNVFKAAVGEYTHRFLNDTSVVEGLRKNITHQQRCQIGAGCRFRIDDLPFLHTSLKDMVRSQRMITNAVSVVSRGCVRELPYEDYLYARESTLKDLFAFLGVEMRQTRPERFKATGDNLCEVVQNWQDVCRAFYGCSVWQGMMEDVANGCFCNSTDVHAAYCDT